MRHLSKQCKNIDQANRYLESIGLRDLTIDPVFFSGEYDYDGWLDSSEANGASVQITKNHEVLVVKYTKKDIDRLEAELMQV